MEPIKSWLERWRKWVPADFVLKQKIQEVLKEVTNLEVGSKQIKVAHHTVYLNLKPAWKAEIFLHRQKILKQLRHKIGHHAPQNIV